MAQLTPDRISRIFVEVADTLVDRFDVIEFLQMVTTRTAMLLDARAAGVLLADHRGKLQLMAASDERAQMVELFQVQAVEGPCQDCFARVEAVVHADLAEAGDTWPSFAPLATSAGYRSVHAFPLRLRREAIGALNVFSERPGRLSDTDAEVVQALADVATIGLLQQRAIEHGELLTEQLQAALDSRIVIEQAKGALAHRLDGTPDEAFDRMRRYARERGRRLSEVAAAVVDDPDSVGDLTRPAG